jgi:hypothetical protein
MPTIGIRRPPNALIAAASKRTLDQVRASPTARDASQLWDLYDRLGELGYGVGFKANAASRLIYYPAHRLDEREPEPVDQGPVYDAYARIQGPAGEFGDLVAELVVHLDVVGEAFLVGQSTADGELWDVWSGDELKSASGRAKRRPDSVELVDSDPFILRIWRPHPRDRAEATSPLSHVRDTAERLILIRGALDAAMRSRLIGKILTIPDELTIVSNTQLPDDGAETDGDPFMGELIETMITAVRDDRAAARIAPIVLRGPGDRLMQIQALDLVRDLPDKLMDMEQSAVRALAAGMDLPAEILLGLSDVNHWTAWQVDESAYRQHVDPVVLMVLDSISRGYLWPTLREGGMTETEARGYLFWRDISPVTVRTVTTSDSIALYDRGIISAEAVRSDAGYSEAEGPETETTIDLSTQSETIGQLIRAGFTAESIIQAVIVGDLNILEHTGLRPVTLAQPAEQAPNSPAVDQSTVKPEPPEPAAEDTDRQPPDLEESVTAAVRTAFANLVWPEPDTTTGNAIVLSRLAQIDRTLMDRITEASQAAFDRVMERAGARVRSHVNPQKHRSSSDLAVWSRIDGIDNLHVTGILGRDVIVERLQLSEKDLIPDGSFDRLGDRVEGMLARAQDATADELSNLTGQTVERDEQEEKTWRQRARDWLIAGLTALGFGRLFKPDTAPDPADTGEIGDSIIPSNLVREVLTVAGGGVIPGGPTDPQGLALGAHSQTVLAESGVQTVGWRWEYG